MGFVTKPHPIIAFCKQLEKQRRRLMEIMGVRFWQMEPDRPSAVSISDYGKQSGGWKVCNCGAS